MKKQQVNTRNDEFENQVAQKLQIQLFGVDAAYLGILGALAPLIEDAQATPEFQSAFRRLESQRQSAGLFPMAALVSNNFNRCFAV